MHHLSTNQLAQLAKDYQKIASVLLEYKLAMQISYQLPNSRIWVEG